VLPATVDTPIYQHAANRTGRVVRPMPPVLPARRVARSIVGLARRPRAVIGVGRIQSGAILVRQLLPRLYDALSRTVVERLGLGRRSAPPTAGNLFVSRPAENRVSGGWRRRGGGGARRRRPRPVHDG
jgi:hypothetical protein